MKKGFLRHLCPIVLVFALSITGCKTTSPAGKSSISKPKIKNEVVLGKHLKKRISVGRRKR